MKHSAKAAAAPAYRPPTNYNSAPNQYYQNNVESAPAPEPAYRQQAAPIQPTYRQPAVYQPEPYQSRFQSGFQSYQAPQQQQRYYNPNQRADFQSHPAIQNFDINSGSYTINYGR